MKKLKSTCKYGLIREGDISDLMEAVEKQLGVEQNTAVHENITEDFLVKASEMMTYLSFCPPNAEMDAKRKDLELSMKVYEPKEILIILNRMLHAKGRQLPYRDAFSKFLGKLGNAWNLQYKEIIALMTGSNCKDCKISKMLLKHQNLAEVTNHPVHIVSEDKTLSPSSFIPFCWFGKNKNLSQKIEKFNLTVCNNFKPKLRNDQVCYEIDPNELLYKGQTANDKVLYFIIDENKDRQTKESIPIEKAHETKDDDDDHEEFIRHFGERTESVVYLNTIGGYRYLFFNSKLLLLFP